MNTKRLISTLLVSFVCILLASSFVLQASADTIKTVVSLQSIALTSATFRDDQEENQAELTYVDALSIKEENPYETGAFNNAYLYSASGYGDAVSFNRSDGVVQTFFTSGKVTFVYADHIEEFVPVSDLSSTVYYPCFTDDYYCFYKNSTIYVYNYENQLVKTWSATTMKYAYLVSYNGYNFVFGYINQTRDVTCFVFDSSFAFIKSYVYSLGTTADPYFYQYGNLVYFVYSKYLAYFDLGRFVFEVTTLSSTLAKASIIRLGEDIYLFESGKTYYKHLSSDLELETLQYPVSFNTFAPYGFSIGVFEGNLFVPGSGCYLRLAPSKQYYYDPMLYSSDSTFVADRFIDFNYVDAGLGAENGGGFIGIDLDFGVPDSFYSANEITGFRFEALVMSYAKTSDAFVYEDVPLPFVLDIKGVNLNVVPTYSPKLVGKVGDVYLYNFTVILFLNGGTITDLNIKLNQYIPAQTETHYFTIPVSTLTLNRWEDTSSGGDISGGGGGNVDLSGIEAELATIKSNLAYVSSVAEETNADVVIIKDSIGDLSDQIDGLYTDIDTLESKIDAIAESLGSLTSVPEDHSSKMEDWWGALTSQDNQLGDMSNAIDGENSFYDDLNSYYEPYLSSPELDPSFEGDISATLGQIGNLDSGEASSLFAFLRNMWTVHPLMLSMSSVVVFLGIIGMYVRSA